MKNKIYYLGTLSAMITACGCIFKIMHWPLAGIFICIGLVSLSLIFLPVAIANMVKVEMDRKLKTFYILVAIVMAFNFIGALFKIMHWPGAGKFLMIGIPLPFVVLLPAYLLANPTEKGINYKNLLAILFFFAYFAAISSILTIRVSYNVIENFTTSARNIQEKTAVLKEAAELNSERRELMNPVDEEAEKLCEKISEIRQMMLEQVKRGQTVNLDVKPLIDIQYLTDLKAEIMKFKSVVRKQFGSDSRSYSYIEEAFAIYSDRPNEATWEALWLDKNIVASALESLNLLEFRVRLIQMES